MEYSWGLIVAGATFAVAFILFLYYLYLWWVAKEQCDSFCRETLTALPKGVKELKVRYRHVLLIRTGGLNPSSYIFVTDEKISDLTQLLHAKPFSGEFCSLAKELHLFREGQDGSALYARPCDILLADVNTPVL